MKIIFSTLLFLLPLIGFAQKDKTTKPAKEEYSLAAIGFYNLENLFDTLDSPNTNDVDFLPTGRLVWNTAKYISKQSNMAKVFGLTIFYSLEESD